MTAVGSHFPRTHLPERLVTLAAVLIPFAAVLWAMVLVWGRGFDWLNLSLLAGMYTLSGFGVTVGFHRFFAHRAFSTGRVLQATLAVLGSMAVQGPLLQWVAFHRGHHSHSDTEKDPHSPHIYGSGPLAVARGFWRAHMGWLFEPYPADLDRYVSDLRADRLLRVISQLFPLWVLAGLLVPAGLGALVTQTWSGALLGLLWGGLVRIFLVHHLTWSVNSVCHIWGTRPFRSHDESRNNPIFGVLAFGEGWHNNHHAFPTSARHGLRWWEFDVSFLLLRLLKRLGLVWNLRTPSADRLAAKRRQPARSDHESETAQGAGAC